MLLGELPLFRKLLEQTSKPAAQQKLITTRIELSKLEVVQCFHVSPIGNRESILRYGLIPKGKLPGSLNSLISYDPRIFVSVVENEIAYDYVGFDDVDVWTFHVKKFLLYPDECSNYANHYYLEEKVGWWELSFQETKHE